mmetsp:Transcript_5695/g.16093  ORF Transcript_5695/g.16093 Transcript_5695/m.16093 type:complete len:244 (-) Transcript_5695:1522-2253(-)
MTSERGKGAISRTLMHSSTVHAGTHGTDGGTFTTSKYTTVSVSLCCCGGVLACAANIWLTRDSSRVLLPVLLVVEWRQVAKRAVAKADISEAAPNSKCCWMYSRYLPSCHLSTRVCTAAASARAAWAYIGSSRSLSTIAPNSNTGTLPPSADTPRQQSALAALCWWSGCVTVAVAWWVFSMSVCWCVCCCATVAAAAGGAIGSCGTPGDVWTARGDVGCCWAAAGGGTWALEGEGGSAPAMSP